MLNNEQKNLQPEMDINNYIGKSMVTNKELDTIELTTLQFCAGVAKSLFITSIAIFVFFVPITVDGKTDIAFSVIYNFFIDFSGNIGLWIITAVIVINALCSIYARYLSDSDTALNRYYAHDSAIHPACYLAGAIFAVIFALHVSLTGYTGPEMIVGDKTGGTVIPAIVVGVAWIIPVGAFFMPFILSYGGIDFVGTILEPFMRPVFRVPGKSAVDAIASLVSSSSMAIIITSRLYKSNVYTKREAAVIATCFSTVSVGFAFLTIKTAGLAEHFLRVYFPALLIAFLVTVVMVRIPPLSGKSDLYKNVEAPARSNNEPAIKRNIFQLGLERAAKRAIISNNILREIRDSLIDGYMVVPKVLSLISAVGISGMIIAEYTPVFNYLGYLFYPIIKLMGIPNAAEISPSVPVGIAEMLLPVLLIADNLDNIDIKARYFVAVLSMVQVIFFSETIVVMLAVRIPVTLRELVICFIERTLIAIPLVSLAAHILF